MEKTSCQVVNITLISIQDFSLFCNKYFLFSYKLFTEKYTETEKGGPEPSFERSEKVLTLFFAVGCKDPEDNQQTECNNIPEDL